MSTTIDYICTGVLHEVHSLQTMYQTDEIIVFTWKEPFTLEGVPIIAYEIHVKIRSWLRGWSEVENITPMSFNTTQNDVNVSRVNHDDICTSVKFSVSAINMAGIGKAASIVTQFPEGNYQTLITKTPV